MMTHTEAIHRAWISLWLGTGILFLVALAVVLGKTPRLDRQWPSGWIRREKEPKTFWFNVLVWLGLALFLLVLATARIIPDSN